MKNNDNKYNQISGLTNRSNINLLKDDSKIINPIIELDNKKINIQLVEIPNKNAEKIPALKYQKPFFLSNQATIFQTPEVQMLAPKSDFHVCPFCKSSDKIIIEYEGSSKQRKLCVLLGLFGLIFCCWIPYLIKNLSKEIYKCRNCKKVLAIKEPEYIFKQ